PAPRSSHRSSVALHDALPISAPGYIGLTALVPPHPLLIEAARAGRQICFHAANGFDAGPAGLCVKIVGAVHVTVIGHGDSRHTHHRKRTRLNPSHASISDAVL